MGGGLLQLVAYGAQDVYLTGNPQITFWKVSYRRYTNFSMELIEQSISGSSTIGANQTKGTVTISRNGDLVGQIYVYSSTAGITQGSQIIQEVEIDIGGQRIDKHFNEWMLLWNELTTAESKAIGLKSLIGDMGSSGTTGTSNVWIPLTFWFCRNPGLALPLIALQYHEVKILFTFGTTALVGVAASVQVFCNYVFLDTDERRRMAQNPHEYLIDQVQTQTGSSTSSLQLNFNHPVKELIFTDAPGSAFTSAVKCNLKLNGQDRFSQQTSEYFQLLQPLEYHTAVPKQNLPVVSQLSTLDRQTQYGAFTNSVVMTGDDAATDSRLFITATGAGSVFGFANPNPPLATEWTAGTQIAIVCTVSAAAPGANGTAGRTYFSTLLSNGTVAGNQLTVNLTIPTTNDSTPLALLTVDDAVADGSFVVFKVTNANSAQARTSKMINNINVYSFSIRPEEHQPSGTCNFSRIDSATLNFTSSVAIVNVYAVNYNVLRIMSGMGGLAYSN
jgi:hypothetical protein